MTTKHTPAKHTPGPWTCTANYSTRHYMVWDADGNYHDMRDEVAEMDANAALIAAAPDLMEALERIERIVRPGTEYTISTAIDAMCEIWNGARAAIAKATDIKEV